MEIANPSTGSLINPLKDEGAQITVTSGAGPGVLGAYVQLIAATAHSHRGFLICITQPTSNQKGRIVIAVGAAASEVIIRTIYTPNVNAWNACFLAWVAMDPSLIPKGSRVSCNYYNDENAVAATSVLAITLAEAND